jgi:4-amino-4-deoxychorismate lyase
MSLAVYINGVKSDCLSIDNRAIHFGDGLFETILIKNAVPTLLDEHLARLSKDAIRLKLPVLNIPSLKKQLLDIAKPFPNVIVKLIVSRQQNQRGYGIAKNQVADSIVIVNPIAKKKLILSVIICQIKLASQPYLAGIKHLNRLEQVLATSELKQGVDEGLLFLHGEDKLQEAISSNIFIIKDSKVTTPKLIKAGVEGIAKQKIIQTAKAQKILIEEKDISLEQLLDADVVFLSNSVFGLRILSQIDKKYFITEHAIYNKLYEQTKSHFIE